MYTSAVVGLRKMQKIIKIINILLIRPQLKYFYNLFSPLETLATYTHMSLSPLFFINKSSLAVKNLNVISPIQLWGFYYAVVSLSLLNGVVYL